MVPMPGACVTSAKNYSESLTKYQYPILNFHTLTQNAKVSKVEIRKLFKF